MAVMNEAAMEAFRAKYRAEIKPGYSGWLHMLSVASVGLAVIIYSLGQVVDASLMAWLTFPITMLVVNFAEYYAHRWLGHRKTKVGGLFYKRHTGDHHTFFLERAMDYQSLRDWRVVLFPVYLIFAFIFGLILPGGYLLQMLVSDNVAYIYAAAGISGYLFYEVMHFSYHIPRGDWAEKIFLCIPGWKQMRHTHVLHHKRELMTAANFNITLPVFDILLGTLYWEPIKEFEAEQAKAS
ncbi:sterol desaturase family protein [Parendozoicomonas sp. Alg238-R29]|uniref:sterol desaturase family protein n=1 Tax=Parendozoicomonas sp. Alg238-R29 TaxID=2993446 RepID=UPI00248D88B0|nr:sterol desaturase family protein [Parendozoicomonas sp. Alg238-R29]